MNDPHVEWLRYRLELGPTLSIAPDAPPREAETDLLKLRLDSGMLTVEMKEHHASIESARDAVRRFLRSWELDNALKYGPGSLRFVYEDGRVVDRNPPPPGSSQIISASGHAGGIAIVGGQAMLTTGRRDYLPPPSNFVVSPDVETLWYRYEMYLEGREPLASMAYFCLTVFKWHGGGSLKRAAVRFGIDKAVLDKLGDLTAKGDEKSIRKFPKPRFTGEALQLQPHTPHEESWLKDVVRMLIRRAGEEAAGVSPSRKLTMDDFPRLL